MKKLAIAGIAASIIGLAGFAGAAQAQCVWTGAFWSCPPAGYGYRSEFAVPPGSTYPAYNNPDWNMGYKPQWLPSMPGPRTSSGAGH